MDELGRFGPATREWFGAAFAAPTAAQAGAWRAISAGRHALVVAPTGSGKTLAAFLWSLDQLAARRCRRAGEALPGAVCQPAQGPGGRRRAQPARAAGRHPAGGRPARAAPPDITVGMRTGDTPADERRAFTKTPARHPHHHARVALSAADLAGPGVAAQRRDGDRRRGPRGRATKRGAHLALSLERLDALLERPAQRIGLSATVRPIDETARFLGGAAPVEVVQPPSARPSRSRSRCRSRT